MTLTHVMMPHPGTSFRFAPYGNPNPTDLSLGRDILLLFGTASLVGVQVSVCGASKAAE